MWGQKVLVVSVHSISSPRPTPRRKKCLGMNEGNPNCQNVLPTLSSTGQNHGRKKNATSPEDIHSQITKEISSHMG